jgi:CRISPR-associated protein Cas1
LRRSQYRLADEPEKSCEIAKYVTLAKIANSRTVILRAIRDHSETINVVDLDKASQRITRILEAVRSNSDLDSLRGWEGDAARTYFSVFDHLIVAQKEDFFFHERNRRPPVDRVNALLSFVYTLLHHDLVSALETVGLDPAVGYLHRDRPGRPGLALDLMEEFRPFFADRLVLSLINRQQIKGKGFKITESGAVQMDDETRKQVLVSYQKRKQEEIRHPFLDEKIQIGLLPFAQALLFARFVRGDLDGYPAFVWK